MKNLVQKILQPHTDQEVVPGHVITARVSLALANDITAPLAIKSFRAMGAGKVFDKDRVALVMDHFTPQKDIESARQVKLTREFAAEMGVTHFYENGEVGVEHALLPELGLVGPGDVVVGADSHTCTYGALGAFATGFGSTDLAAAMALGETWFKVPDSILATFNGALPPYVTGKDLILWLIGQIGVDGARYQAIEFAGSTITAMGMDGRMTMANMAIEAGGKTGLFPVDDTTLAYTRAAGRKHDKPLAADPGAAYIREITHDVANMQPMVACPHQPDNVKPVAEVSGVDIQQVIIGSCTNGRISDMRDAATILRGRRVNKKVRCIVLPATPAIWRQALAEGLIDTFMESGCIVGPATYGPCLGGHMGILAEGERAVATTNRNFRGRMGSLESEVYLTNPAGAAASAVAGEVCHPGRL